MKPIWIGAIISLAIALITVGIIVSCGKPNPPGPGPDPLTEFSVKGKTISVAGKLKPSAMSSVAEATRSFQIAVDLLENK